MIAHQWQGEFAHDPRELFPDAVSRLHGAVVDEVLEAPVLLLTRLAGKREGRRGEE